MLGEPQAGPVAEMLDTTRPWLIPPELAARSAAMPYSNGSYKWPRAQVVRFPRVIHISVTGDPAAAEFARGVDIERYDATVQEAPGFVDARQDEFGHDDATVYSSRSTLASLFAQLGSRRPRLIVATLDGYPWTPAELAIDIIRNWNVPGFDAEWIWGIQNIPANSAAGRWWDITAVWGLPDFTNPLGDPA